MGTLFYSKEKDMLTRYRKVNRYFIFFCFCLIVFPLICRAQAPRAKVELIDKAGKSVGTILLEETHQGVYITGKVIDLPLGVHGFHIHERGECVPPEFKESGGHFNPYEKEHGFLNPKGPHAGDLPNIMANDKGEAEIDIVTKLITLEKDKENSLFKEGSTALVIHQNEDDYITDPAGMGGSRIACGIIEEIE